ncbi:hypothetical protein JTE90_008111 [Oedothorax gibbosus]|uniref:Integrase catalytic domain-containing protein n=1 Tax=Oedothorax gibbosus TaxID=931172 RepID=A0AAV6V1Y1_9ARAC|nr:hypothetical protein JTE90_008111 [Oedothorax gibbosus]
MGNPYGVPEKISTDQGRQFERTSSQFVPRVFRRHKTRTPRGPPPSVERKGRDSTGPLSPPVRATPQNDGRKCYPRFPLWEIRSRTEGGHKTSSNRVSLRCPKNVYLEISKVRED